MITKSAKKAHRQNLRRRVKNLNKKKSVKAVIKAFKALIAKGDTETAKQELPKVYKALDKIAKIGVFKQNKTSRFKSRLAKLLNKKNTA